jgi:hypothetical protein
MTLFPPGPRTDPSPARHNESHYDFLSRVDEDTWERVRRELTRWVDEVPPEVRADVIARLQSDDAQHRAAWWEIYLHAALLRGNCTLTAHPVVAGTTRRPDYLVTALGGPLYLEARITGHPPTGIAARRRLNTVYDLLNDIDSPNFFIGVDVESTGPNPPGTRQLRRDLEAWLGTLDPDAITSPDKFPEWEWINSKGWSLLFRAIPKQDARGRPGMRAVGMYDDGGVRIIDHKAPLQDALQFKGSRYGEPDAPFVVAVMDDSDHPPDSSTIADALYGTLVGDFDPVTRTVIERRQRAPDGYWKDGSGPRHTSVSAVITAWSLSPWDVARRYPRLWHNPTADRPLRSHLPFPSVRYRPELNDFVEEGATMAPHELFGLAKDWPGFRRKSWEPPDGAE